MRGGVDRLQREIKSAHRPDGTRSTRAPIPSAPINSPLFIYLSNGAAVPRHLITAIYAHEDRRCEATDEEGLIGGDKSAADTWRGFAERICSGSRHRVAETRRHAILSNELACSCGGGERFVSRRDTRTWPPPRRYADGGKRSAGTLVMGSRRDSGYPFSRLLRRGCP